MKLDVNKMIKEELKCALQEGKGIKIDFYGDPVTVQTKIQKDKTGHLFVSLVEDGAPFARLTVILPETADLPKDEFFVKDWSENRDIVKQLIKQKVLIPGKSSAKTGHVTAKSYKLNPKFK